MQVYLMRHGQTKEGMQDLLLSGLDPELSPEGAARIKMLCPSMDKDIDLIIASPLKRAVQTAEIVAKELGKEVKVEEILKESDPEKLQVFFEGLKAAGHKKVLAVTHFVVIDPFYAMFPRQKRHEIKHGTIHEFEI